MKKYWENKRLLCHMLLYNNDKGFCVGSLTPTAQEKPPGISSGFDLLPWPESFEDEEEIPLADEGKDEEVSKKKLSKKEKREMKQQRKVRASHQKQLKRLQELQGESVRVRPNKANSYELVNSIRKVREKIINELKNSSSITTSSDCKLFQYQSVSFYRSDLEHLMPDEWLCDNVLSFVYEILVETFVKPLPHSDQLFLLFPSLVQLFLHMPYDDSAVLECLLPIKEMKSLRLVFVPVNYIDDVESTDLEDNNNGDHWFLCVLNILEGKLLVYDSMVSDDDDDSLLEELGKRFCALPSLGIRLVSIQKMKCPQQTNFDDCGVYLLMFTCAILSQLLGYEQNNKDGQSADQGDERFASLDLSGYSFEPLEGRLFIMQQVYENFRCNLAN